MVIPFVIVWFGGTILFGFHYRAARRAYLQRFPHVAGMPLDMYLPGGPRSVRRAIFRVTWQRQTDPDLERLRRAMWRSLLYQAIWVFGFFFILSGVIVLSNGAGPQR